MKDIIADLHVKMFAREDIPLVSTSYLRLIHDGKV